MIKRITFCLLLILCLSCGSDKVTISKEEYKRLTGDTLVPEYPKQFRVNEITYKIYLGSDGHEYYETHGHHYNTDIAIHHYPGCVKCNKPPIQVQ